MHVKVHAYGGKVEPIRSSGISRGVLKREKLYSIASVEVFKAEQSRYMAEHGIEVLADPPKADTDVLFVHGLFGHRTNTWNKNGIVWPRTLLPTDVSNARIMTFGYDADVIKLGSGRVTNSAFESHAADMCERMAQLRAMTDTPERPIILVAHSLGGLICAEALVIGDRAAGSDNTSIIAHNIQGMVFLGTPFHGSRHAKWANMLQNVAHAFFETNTKKTKDLLESSDKLKTLAEAFPDVLRKRDLERRSIGVAFFVETLKYRGVLVVEADSAWIPGRGDHASIHANHIDICKFEHREDEGYRSVVGAVKKFAGIKTGDNRPEDRGTVFHNYGDVKNQVGGDQNIAGNIVFQ